jgi:excisionase family DNA binding protein
MIEGYTRLYWNTDGCRRKAEDKKEMNTSMNFLTPEQVADILQVNILTVYSYIKKNRLGAVRLGRSYRIATQDLERFVELNRVNKTGNAPPGKEQ